MPPGVSTSWLVLPLMLRGLVLLFVALPVANVTFRIFAVEEYNHGCRLNNIAKKLSHSFATATMIKSAPLRRPRCAACRVCESAQSR
ncbi:hypothetical protein RA280_30840 [Cupriavidus sp. CV2]|uniref:hypothetical protein n=1 Tax=Cupriavidus ulmosensis TaxID=3065913 RepID=UPI00296B25AD|nr:hypothetical protein [Cupriavidus sp. CV2]MDW3686062.1 hypothetical protein [Cupriavidus sp. CV2]